MLFVFLILFAYLIGSISTAIIVCRMLGLPDPRTQGSGNPGATNVLRFGGKKLAIIVLVGDALKGVLPVLVAQLLNVSNDLLSWIALAAFLGHLYPVFFGFKGGKGVATAIGSILALSWPLGLLLIVTWLVIAFAFRYSSLAAIVAAVASPFYAYWIIPDVNYLPIILLSFLLIWRHYSNIKRLIKGKESKLGKK